MEFALVQIKFPDSNPNSETSSPSSLPPSKSQSPPSPDVPFFHPLKTFKMTGLVMNVFLLDPVARLLSGFVWIVNSSTIGLFVLLDWDKDEFVFVDTRIPCVRPLLLPPLSPNPNQKPSNSHPSSPFIIQVSSHNWSCILRNSEIVIHSEESDRAVQHFYPLSLLQQHVAPLTRANNFAPWVTGILESPCVVERLFEFPRLPESSYRPPFEDDEEGWGAAPVQAEMVAGMEMGGWDGQGQGHAISDVPSTSMSISSGPTTDTTSITTTNGSSNTTNTNTTHPSRPSSPNQIPSDPSPALTHPSPAPNHHPGPHPNPFTFPTWYPESAHFVRQWWPTLAGVPSLSCTVVLLAHHHRSTHRTKYVLSQHYFQVPVSGTSMSYPLLLNGDGGGGGVNGKGKGREGREGREVGEDALMKMWYISAPFEIVCVMDVVTDDQQTGTANGNGNGAGQNEATTEHPRPLLAVDFGHAVWIEYYRPEEEAEGEGEGSSSNGPARAGAEVDEPEPDPNEPLTLPNHNHDHNHNHTHHNHRDRTEPTEADLHAGESKRLRFVSFPSISFEQDGRVVRSGIEGEGSGTEGVVRTLEVPEELDLDKVETLNIDQSQGAVIMSVREGRIFILCYE